MTNQVHWFGSPLTLAQYPSASGAASIAAVAAAAAVGGREKAAALEDSKRLGKGKAEAEAWAEEGGSA